MSSRLKDYTENQWRDYLAEKLDQYEDKELFLKLSKRSLNDVSLENFARGLKSVAQRREIRLESLYLDGNSFGEKGLRALIDVFLLFPEIQDTLEEFDLSRNEIKTIEPLGHPRLFRNLGWLYVNTCGLSDELPTLTLPKLRYLNMIGNNEIVLSEMFLRAIRPDCLVNCDNSRTKVQFSLQGKPGLGGPPTIDEIAQLAWIDLSREPRTRGVLPPLRSGANCSSCSAPRASFVCGACEQRAYCNESCQLQDWEEEHQESCSK